ncbi:M28 family peptidase [Stackebrandtia nassauensis]|uniref:Peptidase M28 n=1 Tax=Stackebrandtia nassauensis (strain DSM 44728 / CIP 108903 / NRRL B-16338 / NBRC 102104 / LLR-40K-21) TaxID=446470 RepID=D3PWF0_STANL|nr:M28 family peptidase [Stackebrandtia nassauensis]ADD41307.1 peptidase M28 [Stackebrandtia nassauensis DSM 44728]
MSMFKRLLLVLVTITLTTFSMTAVAQADQRLAPPDIPGANSMAHANQLQSIATANGGNRAHGTSGYRASADFIQSTLSRAGFTVTRQQFTYNGALGWNVIAEWPVGNPNDVVFLGAHLDGVRAGAGINDNGSGSSAVLETALAVARDNAQPTKRLRFGWWGAEENGLIGSAYYTRNLPSSERAKIDAYLNFDMVGQRDTTRWGIYVDSPTLGATFKQYFDSKGIATRSIDISGRSDHASFARYGIPVSGISSGSDPCYHSRCDTIANIGERVMGHSTNAAAYAAWRLAGIP